MEVAKAYDSLPYPSKFFTKTHPDHLAALAGLYGMNPKPPEQCRVLELGCGNGSNLISHAFYLPEAEFVGVDISGKHIDRAKDWTNDLKLKNLDFREIDLSEMTRGEFGEFDYIVGHGLISWIPESVTEKVFEIFREMLAPEGVGYLSYNTYPGSHYRNMVRQIMRFHTKAIDEPMQQIQESISFLSLLSENTNEKKVFQTILDSELKRHFERDASDIFHDDLSEAYRPLYFHEFVARLKENGLQYLCETELHAMSVKNFPPAVQEFINRIEDTVEREQYIDFFLGRVFRQTLFCREKIDLNRHPEPSAMDKFLVASSIRPAAENPELSVQKPEKFAAGKGFGIEIDHPPTKTAFNILGNSWAQAVPVTELLRRSREELEKTDYAPADWEKEFGITRAIMFQIVQATDLIKLHVFQPEAVQEVSRMPQINELARWQITEETDSVTTLFAINIEIDDEVSRHLLKLLDGTRDRRRLLEDLREFIEANEEIEGKPELLDNLENWLDESLTQLARLGLFVS
jgi:methyltransferase-like protein/cyclopropane fatty-acyl-phospholipid synthase-like methyltransferase